MKLAAKLLFLICISLSIFVIEQPVEVKAFGGSSADDCIDSCYDFGMDCRSLAQSVYWSNLAICGDIMAYEEQDRCQREARREFDRETNECNTRQVQCLRWCVI